jgi:hypothetical protein
MGEFYLKSNGQALPIGGTGHRQSCPKMFVVNNYDINETALQKLIIDCNSLIGPIRRFNRRILNLKQM